MLYKLTYFDGRGRGEPIRMLFALVNVKFTDNRIKNEDWPALKPIQKWGVLPTLHVGDQEIGQTGTILRFLAKKFKLTGADEWESTRCDEIYDALNDFFGEAVKYLFEPNEAKKVELKTALGTTLVPKYFGQLDTMQHDNGGTWLVGKNVTWIDIYLVYMMESVDLNASRLLVSFLVSWDTFNCIYTQIQLKVTKDTKKETKSQLALVDFTTFRIPSFTKN